MDVGLLTDLKVTDGDARKAIRQRPVFTTCDLLKYRQTVEKVLIAEERVEK